MRVIVLGAGIIGVTTAYELLRDGHDVTVLDRQAEAASETSFANAGLVAPSHAFSWASPSAPKMLLRSLWRDDQALRFRPSLDPALWRWTLKFLGQCSSGKAAANSQRKAQLCLYSQSRLGVINGESALAYDGQQGGLLYLYRSPESFAAAQAKMEILKDVDVTVKALSPEQAAEIDPALAPVAEHLAGALYGPDDESGNARDFTRALAQLCQEKGADFHFGTTITGLERQGDRIVGATTDQGPLTADAVVLCLGVYSPHLARQLGERLPIYPIKGYSVTLPVAGRNNPPTLGGVDEDNLVAYCPMGDRVRITATAEFSGYDTSHRPQDFRHMLSVAKQLFPNAGDYAQPSYWAGLRPMTPRGIPIFGRGRHQNLYYNTGHGHMGWTMSCGSARIAADLVAGRKPEIDIAGMQLQDA